ncbi:MAG: hypothetical protein FWE67_12320 [Planctomycetaceae bacterium]|nr:hypothetical protein [Planctomycetaceae bacterium]
MKHLTDMMPTIGTESKPLYPTTVFMKISQGGQTTMRINNSSALTQIVLDFTVRWTFPTARLWKRRIAEATGYDNSSVSGLAGETTLNQIK